MYFSAHLNLDAEFS